MSTVNSTVFNSQGPMIRPSSTSQQLAPGGAVHDPMAPVDTVDLGGSGYTDPTEAWKAGASVGTAVGGTLGCATGVAVAPEAAFFTGQLGLVAGSGLGYLVGGAVGAGAAHASNALESVYHFVTGR